MENNAEDKIKDCNESSLWGFKRKRRNEYGTYINSKFRLDNIINIDSIGQDFSDQLSMLKILLRTAKGMKIKQLETLIELGDPNEMEKVFKEIISKVRNEGLKTTQLEIFVEGVLSENPNYKKLCGGANVALLELKAYEKKIEEDSKIERYGSYIIDDYSQIVSSSSFRRMQDKAQVFSLEKIDFSRSRLTHSNEVASNCEIMANYLDFYKLFNVSKNDDEHFKEDCVLILRCAGLIHDIGNPPFGHYGEEIIRNFFKEKLEKEEIDYKEDFTKFDGNAQSLRVVSKLQYFGHKKSLCLTAGVLGSIIKYPFSSKYNYGKDKFGYFKSEELIINGLEAAGVYRENIRNPFVILLEAADDISYLTADLEDAIHKGIITKNSFKKFKYSDDSKTREFYEKIKNHHNQNMDDYLGFEYNDNNERIMPTKSTIAKDEKRIFEKTMRPIIAKLRQELLIACANQFIKDVDKIINVGSQIENVDNTYELLEEIADYKKLKKNLKDIMTTLYSTEEVIDPEVQGHKILNTILSNYYDAIMSMKIENGKMSWEDDEKHKKYYEKLMSYVSKDFIEVYEKETEKCEDNNSIKYYKMHLLLDFVSGMTDSYAESIYNLLIGNK